MQYKTEQISQIIHGNIIIKQYSVINEVSIDSRNVQHGTNVLFFCIVGKNNNGHFFIQKCYEIGVRNFVISEQINLLNFPDANFIEVENSLTALQLFAQYHRSLFKIPVIGITGSNGKTIIKEWLYQLLSADKNVVKSPKSYNSQVGVPLSVLNIEPTNELAIFEAGISTKNQMVFLAKIIQPTIGIFSNIGPAHDAGFNSLDEKINEKLELFVNAETIIYCADHTLIHEKLADKKNTIAWRIINQSDAEYTIEIDSTSTPIKQIETFNIYFKDKASIENCLHCIVTLLVLGYHTKQIQEKITILRNLPMRLELKYGINQCTIIDDTYSADFLSLQIAVDFLNQQETNKKKTLILSGFEESGLSSSEFIDKLNKLISNNHFDKLIGVGKVFVEQSQQIKNIEKIFVYQSTEKLLSSINDVIFFNEIILIKGARKYEFERILQVLIEKTHETVLEINLNSMIHNLNIYKSSLKKGVGIIAMVKAFSYGNGSVELASLLEQNKVAYLAVAYADEGVLLRRNGIAIPILVMNPDKADFARMLAFKLEPEIYSLKILDELIDTLENQTINIHLKIETGMNRLGFPNDETNLLVEHLKQHKNIIVKTIFSHLAGSEDARFDDFTKEQISRFIAVSLKIEQGLGYKIKRHILNSAGIVRFSNAQFDFVRLGIGLYGVDGSTIIQKQLEPIGKLKTRIAQIKIVSAEESIGYSRKGKINRNSKIGTLAIGYADGFDRRFGNGVGEVFVAGRRVSIIGNICMDMCMVDLTDIPEIKVGDEVEIYGKNISIIEQAEKIGTIPYELLTSISSRVKRIYFMD